MKDIAATYKCICHLSHELIVRKINQSLTSGSTLVTVSIIVRNSCDDIDDGVAFLCNAILSRVSAAIIVTLTWVIYCGAVFQFILRDKFERCRSSVSSFCTRPKPKTARDSSLLHRPFETTHVSQFIIVWTVLFKWSKCRPASAVFLTRDSAIIYLETCIRRLMKSPIRLQ